ncbi:MAG TPA: DMT family transporter [Kofleriaceae bacterium]|nr:DMT family transporter [Kofleriaceae bacterium]
MTAVAYVICAVVWGTTWFAIRVSIGPGGYPTYFAAALRFSMAAAALLVVWRLGFARPGPRSRKQLAWLVVAGLLNAIGYGLVYTGEEQLSGGLTAAIFGTMPLATAIIAGATGTEKIARSAMAGAVVALAGIIIIFSDRMSLSIHDALAVTFVVGAVVASATYSVIFKRHGDGIHPLSAVTVFITVTAVTMWAITGIGERTLPPWPPALGPTVATVYLAVLGSIVAFVSYFYLLQRATLMTVMTLVFVEPVIALAVDAVWADQIAMTPSAYLGVGVTLSGVLVSVVGPRVTRSLRGG